jgi:hypothetical protein
MVDPRRQPHREIIGLIIIVVIITMAIAIFFLDEIRHGLKDTYQLVAVFQEAPRLRPGSQVWVAGRNAGRVDKVELLPPSSDSLKRVAIRLELPRDVQRILTRGTQLRLTSARLIGDPVVDLTPPVQAGPPLQEGDTLRLTAPVNTTAELKADFTIVRASLDTLMRDVTSLRIRVDRRAVQLRRVQAQASQAGAELSELQRQMDSGTGTLGLVLNDPEWSNTLERVQSNGLLIMQAVRATQERANAALGDSIRREKLMRDVRELSLQISTLQKLANSPSGYFGRSQRDSALAKAMTGARAQLDSLMTEAKKNPMRFVF